MKEIKLSLETQVKDLNEKLRVLIKQRSPGYIFLTGIFHSLGSVFGTVVVLGALGLLLSRMLTTFNFTKVAVDWVGQVMEQSVGKVMPAQPNIPEVNLDEQE
ncbi:hypothetical protein ISS42_00135 [Candidatus Shapirobacteria bacterium]|nr:hypothetical protein [Candidatus Shapirobacteria bacterium]